MRGIGGFSDLTGEYGELSDVDRVTAQEVMDGPDDFPEDVDTDASAETLGEFSTPEERLLEKIDEVAHNEELSIQHRKEILLDLREQLLEIQAGQNTDVTGADEEGPSLVLKMDERRLLEITAQSVRDQLEARADDYRDKGYSEDEIAAMLAQDEVAIQAEALQTAFPGQDISPAVLQGYGPRLSAAGVRHGDVRALSDIQSWIGEINPNFDEFDTESPYCNNCGSCAFAVYQRLEGLSDDSCASAENIDYNDEMNALTGMEQVSMSPDEIRDRLLAEGEGAHAIIGIDRAEGPGHWFNAACVDGKVVAIDGQTGEIMDWPPDYGDVVNWEMSVKKGA